MSTLVPARISTKFILLAVSLVLLTALALSILFVQRIRFESEATLISNGRDFARLLASNSEYAIYTEDTAVLRSLMNSLSGREEITYASIIGADGRTLIDRWFQETLLELPTLDPPSEQREQAGAPVDAPQFTSTTDGLRYQDLIASVLTPSIDADEDLLDSSLGTDELAEIGYVRLILNEKGIKRRTDELIWATVLLATVLSTLAIVVTIFLANRIAAPISVLVAATRRVAARQLDEDIRVNTTGELKELSDGFNYMLDGLRRYRSEREIQQEVLERKVAERTRSLEAAKTEAEAASHAKSEFLARMSHEIRTPMNGVLGMTELLLSSTKLDQQQRRYAETIYQSGDSLLAIINDILDVAKIESGKLELDIAPFDIRRTVEESLELLAEQAHSKGL